MRKFLNFLVLVPLALLFVAFAVANRHFITVSFDPFNSADPAMHVTLPLFAILIGVAILGVAAGGTATWIRQRSWRRAARMHQADAIEARAQLADLRASLSVSQAAERPPQPQWLRIGDDQRDKSRMTM